MEKTCSNCKKTYPKNEKYFRKNGSSWRSGCKKCINKNLPKKTKKQKEERKAEMYKIWRLKNRPAKVKSVLKTCISCKKELERTLDNFRKRSDSDALRSSCKKCFDEKQRKRHIEFYKNNTEKERLRHKNWAVNNPEKRKATIRKTYLKNIIKNKEYDKKRTQELTDSKVSNMLGFRLNEVPRDVLETKRLLLKLKRELK